jgi:7-cyano-7-deazaguanine tRNA-ribosyltransferase
MLDIVAWISLKNLKPNVWDETSSYYLPDLQAIMVSYADFHAVPHKRKMAIEQGLHAYLDLPKRVKIYLDNGSFYFMRRGGDTPTTEYEEFVKEAKPDLVPDPAGFHPIAEDEEGRTEKLL